MSRMAQSLVLELAACQNATSAANVCFPEVTPPLHRVRRRLAASSGLLMVEDYHGHFETSRP